MENIRMILLRRGMKGIGKKWRGVKSNRKQTHNDTILRLEKLFTQLNAPEIQFFVETEKSRKIEKDGHVSNKGKYFMPRNIL